MEKCIYYLRLKLSLMFCCRQYINKPYVSSQGRKSDAVTGQRYLYVLFSWSLHHKYLYYKSKFHINIHFISSIVCRNFCATHDNTCTYRCGQWSSPVWSSHHVLAYRDHTCEMMMVNVIY